MRRFTLCLFIWSLAACSGGSHKIPISRSLKPAGNKGSSSQLVDKMITPGKTKDGVAIPGCLNMPNVLSAITAATETYSIYTSDMDLGDLVLGTGADAQCPQFVSAKDSLSSAAVFLQKSAETKPAFVAQNPSSILQSSEVGPLLNFSSQDACNTATFATAVHPQAAPEYKIVCKSARAITLQAVGPQKSYVSYAVTNSALTITYFLPVTVPSNCPGVDASQKIAKVTRVVSLTEPRDKVRLQATFAELLNKWVLSSPPELKNTIGPRDPSGGKGNSKALLADSVEISALSYQNVTLQFASGQTQLMCTDTKAP